MIYWLKNVASHYLTISNKIFTFRCSCLHSGVSLLVVTKKYLLIIISPVTRKWLVVTVILLWQWSKSNIFFEFGYFLFNCLMVYKRFWKCFHVMKGYHFCSTHFHFHFHPLPKLLVWTWCSFLGILFMFHSYLITFFLIYSSFFHKSIMACFIFVLALLW